MGETEPGGQRGQGLDWGWGVQAQGSGLKQHWRPQESLVRSLRAMENHDRF